jgi:uncharacterized protein YkwD
MSRCKRWTIIIFCVTLASLAGQVAFSAEPDPPPGYALGAYDPDEGTSQAIVFETLTVDAAPALLPDACDWASTYEEELVCLINQERRAVGLAPYQVNALLTTIAREHSAVMRDQNCFSHQCGDELGPAGRACNAGYKPYCWGDCFIGEAIAAGFPSAISTAEAWMGSAGHRDILLHGELREIGVGYVAGGSYGHYWTASFGSQPDVLPVFINYDDAQTDTRQVTVTLTNEEVSGCGGIDYADAVMLSNDPNFNGAQWEAYALHKPWTLSEGNGTKTVYVQYQDSTDYQVTAVDDILLDELFPYDLKLGSSELVYLYQVGNGFYGSTDRAVDIENMASSLAMDWHAECSGGGMWPGITPQEGSTPDKLFISVDNFTTSQPDVYYETITVTSPQDPDQPEEVTVTIIAVEQVHRVLLPLVAKAAE